MSQNFTDNCYVLTNLIAGVSSDLQDIENNFITLKGTFSSGSAPVTGGDYSTVAGLAWYDTTNTQLKYRNSANNGWMYFFPGDATSKIWAYRNDAVEGMIVDSSVTDKVLAIKGGSQGYAITGGGLGGSWTTLSHTHGAGSYTVNTYHRHELGAESMYQDGIALEDADFYTDYQGSTTQPVAGTSTSGIIIATWRPTAAVGILLKPDL